MEKKILVPLDGSTTSERAINQAEKIAKAFGYEIVLFRVIDTPLETSPEAEQEEAITYLKGVESRIEGEGIKTRIEVGAGYPHSAILAMADKEDVELIVMTTHGHTGLAAVLVGSVAEKVLHATERPVLLVKPEKIHKTRTDGEKAILSARS
jgi:nucleotide-binding universal stress UspA family protein